MFLHLVGRQLVESGCAVFIVNHAGHLDKFDEAHFKTVAQQAQKRGQDCVILVDEVQTNFNSPLWNIMLKDHPKNLIVVGVGVKRLGVASPQFVFKNPSTSIFMTNSDVREAIEFWRKQRPEMDVQVIEEACRCLLQHTGGHYYPFVKIAEHVFGDASIPLDRPRLEHYLRSEEFSKTLVHNDVISRCFGFLEGEMIIHASKILEGDLDKPAILALEDVGFWKDGWFTSDLLVNFVLSKISLAVSTPVLLDESKDWQDNVEILLTAGLRNMTEDDFLEPNSSNLKYENSIGFNWAWRTKQAVKNVYLTAQTTPSERTEGRGQSPTVDFYVNGRINAALELVRNADSSMLCQKFDKFKVVQTIGKNAGKPGPYRQWERNAVLNLELTRVQEPKLAANDGQNNRLWTFMKTTNTLFRGSRAVQHNVVRALASPQGNRQFSSRASSVGLRALRLLL